MEDVNITETVLAYLKKNHIGEKKAVQSRCLEKRFHVSNRNIRNIVNTLRCNGIPICSDENGYYYAADQNEVMRSIRQLNSRIGKIAEAKRGLMNSLSLFPDSSGQMELELWIIGEKGG